MKNKGLGKGLAALIGEQNINNDDGATTSSSSLINISNIKPNKFQPRKTFNDETIEELASSIARHGIIQPIVVRKIADDNYQIIAGERRWRAAKIAGLSEVPVVTKEIDDKTVAEQALIENIQREDLNPIEEAKGYLELMNNYSYSQEELSGAIGKNRSHIANMLRLNTLPDSVKNHILSNNLSFSHAKVIAGHDSAEDIANEIVKKHLSVRQTEQLVKTWSGKPVPKASDSPKAKDKTSSNDLQAIGDSLTDSLGVKVVIEGKGSSGKVIVQYNNFVQLDNIIELLSSK